MIDLSEKTVVELRKIAKENGVVLGTGVSKAGIIAKLQAALGDEASAEPVQQAIQPEVTRPAEPQPAAAPAPSSAANAGQVQFRAAWKNPAPASPRYNSKPAYQAPRPAAGWQAPAAAHPVQQQDTPPRIGGTVRPATFTPRFGPQAGQEITREAEPARPAVPPRPWQIRPAEEQPHTFGPQSGERSFGPQHSEARLAPAVTSAESSYQRPYPPRPAPVPESAAPVPKPEELVTPMEYEDGSGVLELHPEGYGFLRSESLLPSSHDIYVSLAQIRRFGLRSGDRVAGKTRPKREGDKYAAMLYVTEINGAAPAEDAQRPVFDELTSVYADRRICLDPPAGKRCDAARMIDLVAPLGFGQRALLLCPPDCGKADILCQLSGTIQANYPDACVMLLMVEEFPEDVTAVREKAGCTVLASTFDQPPEIHLRLAELTLEYAERQAEMGRDVVILVDTLTRLAKTFTTSSAQQGRYMPGQVNPASLMRAKKLFGAARSLQEGGSITVIGAMNVDNDNRVDDVVVEEFKGTAHTELWLESAIKHAGASIPLNISRSTAHKCDTLLTGEEANDLQMVRSELAAMSASQATLQLLGLIEKTNTNRELIDKLKSLSALMRGMK